MNQAIVKEITLTTSWQPIVTGRTHGSADVSCLPTNGAAADVRVGSTGDGTAWQIGEYHRFNNVDLSTIEVKGEAGDKVSVIGEGV